MSKLKAAQALAFPGGKLEFIDDDHVCFLHGNCVAVAKVDAPERVEFLTHAFERGVSAFATNHRTSCVALCPRAHDPSVLVARWPSREVKATLTGGTDLEYVAVAFSRDGGRVVAISAATDHALFVWDVASQAKLISAPLLSASRFVSVNPADPDLLCTGGRKGLVLWRLSNILGERSLAATNRPPDAAGDDAAGADEEEDEEDAEAAPRRRLDARFTAHCWASATSCTPASQSGFVCEVTAHGRAARHARRRRRRDVHGPRAAGGARRRRGPTAPPARRADTAEPRRARERRDDGRGAGGTRAAAPRSAPSLAVAPGFARRRHARRHVHLGARGRPATRAATTARSGRAARADCHAGPIAAVCAMPHARRAARARRRDRRRRRHGAPLGRGRRGPRPPALQRRAAAGRRGPGRRPSRPPAVTAPRARPRRRLSPSGRPATLPRARRPTGPPGGGAGPGSSRREPRALPAPVPCPAPSAPRRRRRRLERRGRRPPRRRSTAGRLPCSAADPGGAPAGVARRHAASSAARRRAPRASRSSRRGAEGVQLAPSPSGRRRRRAAGRVRDRAPVSRARRRSRSPSGRDDGVARGRELRRAAAAGAAAARRSRARSPTGARIRRASLRVRAPNGERSRRAGSTASSRSEAARRAGEAAPRRRDVRARGPVVARVGDDCKTVYSAGADGALFGPSRGRARTRGARSAELHALAEKARAAGRAAGAGRARDVGPEERASRIAEAAAPRSTRRRAQRNVVADSARAGAISRQERDAGELDQLERDAFVVDVAGRARRSRREVAAEAHRASIKADDAEGARRGLLKAECWDAMDVHHKECRALSDELVAPTSRPRRWAPSARRPSA